jgi:hypothetical protein
MYMGCRRKEQNSQYAGFEDMENLGIDDAVDVDDDDDDDVGK